MNASHAQVSVVIPTYNGAPFIGDALRSVLGQTQPPAEIIVVDDASTDGTAEVVRRWSQRTSTPLRLISLAANSGGPARPLNVGIDAARHEFIAVLDQDDVFVPARLELLGTVLAAQRDASFAFSACGRLGSGTWRGSGGFQSASVLRRLHRAGGRRPGCQLIDGHLAAAVLMVHGDFVVGYPGFLFRRSDWRLKGGLDESLRVGSDYDLLCWLCLRGPAAFVPRALYLRRVHGANLSRGGTTTAADCLRVVRRYCGDVGPLPAQARHWLRCLFLRRITCLSWDGAHRQAARLLWDCTSEWGWTSETPWTAAKLLLLWAARSVLCGGTPARPERAEISAALLTTVRPLCVDEDSRSGSH
jgi:glycosyltransferase involved in cell wall biosynthesis